MIYVIAEDTTSALEFWQRAISAFKNETEYEIVHMEDSKHGDKIGGVDVLYDKFCIAREKGLHQGDKIIALIDEVGGGNQLVVDFLDAVNAECPKYGVTFIWTAYYCFEELYLSYDEVLRLAKTNNKANVQMIKALDYVHDCINKGVDYYSRNDARIKAIIDMKPKADVNREHFADVLLNMATLGIGSGLHIKKEAEAFGECWAVSCDEIQEKMKSIYHVDDRCNKKCRYCCKGKDNVAKILDLENRSMMKDCGVVPSNL